MANKTIIEFSDGWIKQNPELFTEQFMSFKEKFPAKEWDHAVEYWPNNTFLIAAPKGASVEMEM